MSHHGVLVAMVVLGVEEANDKRRYWDGDYCRHDEIEDRHVTLPPENARANTVRRFSLSY